LYNSTLQLKGKIVARTKNKPDYLNLPFEVHFSSIAITSYELMYDPKKPPKWMEDYSVIERLQGTAEDVVFECLDNTHGELKAILIGGILEEYIPRWLELMSEGYVDMNYGEKLTFSIRDGEMQLGSPLAKHDHLEHEGDVATPSFYGNCGTEPDFIILDSKNTRVCIDLQGYELDEDGERVSDVPLFDFDSDEMHEYEAVSFEERDTMIELGSFF
jgi:hypothetical protein